MKELDICINKQAYIVRLQKILLSLTSLFLISLSFGQKGFISGTVISVDGDTMAYAKVFIDSTTYYNYSKKSGYYLLKNVEPGTYKVSAYSSNRELSTEIPDVVVKAGDTTFLDLKLAVKSVKVAGTVLVFQSANKDGEAGVAEEVKNADVAVSAIDATQVKKVSNVTQAAVKITGVSVVGGKYVYIRGLSDRYSKTILNGAEIPGLDPNVNSVQLDMIPTTFISSMAVYKTYSPEYPADWAGGMLDLRTKEYPESDSIQINLNIGLTYNTMGNFKSDYLTYEGGKLDFLGFDDGTRKLPSYINELNEAGELNKLNRVPRPENQEAYTKGIKSFNKIMQPSTGFSPINHNGSLTVGNKKQWYKKDSDSTLDNRKTFGYFAGASYRRSYSYFDDGIRGKYFLSDQVETVDELLTRRELNWRQGSDNVIFGTLLNLKYVPNKKNSLGFNYIHNHSGQSQTSIVEGFADEELNVTFRNQQLGYLQRSMDAVQFYGNHKVVHPDTVKNRSRAKKFSGSIDAPYIDWTAAYTLAKQSEPDLRYITDDYTVDAGGNTVFKFSSVYNAPARYFRAMQEYNLDHKINFTLPIEIDSAKIIEFKVGVSNLTKLRDFTEIRLDLATNDSYNGNMQDFLADDNIGYQNGDFQVGLLDLSAPKNNYTGFSSVTGGFMKIKAPIGNRLEFVGGVRDEMTVIRVTSYDPSLPVGELVRNDILPSVNFNYSIWKDVLHRDRVDTTKNNKRDLKLRLGYNKTLARPNFRELAAYATEDYDLGYILIGNKDLDRTLIDNFDLKLEYFPRKLETFSVATFYKKFTNPIELSVNVEAANDEFQWRQVPTAYVYGIELEFKKRLDFVSTRLEDWRIGGNMAITKSAIPIQQKELDNIRATDKDAPSSRPLFGQSPYLINGSIEFIPDTSKYSEAFKSSKMAKLLAETNIALDYNVFGPRLVLVVSGGTPDVYEMPFHTLNLTINKKISERMSVSIKGMNLLNSRVRQIYRFYGDSPSYEKFGDNYVFSQNRQGVNISGSLSYKF